MFSHKHTPVAVIALMLAAALTSCIEHGDPAFNVTVNSQVVQSYNADSAKIFAPYFYVVCFLERESIQSATVQKLGNSQDMTMIRSSLFESNVNDNWSTNLSDVNGTYTITATSNKNNIYTTTVNIAVANADTLGRIRLKELSFDGDSIRVKMFKVANAQTYGISAAPFNDGETPHRAMAYHYPLDNITFQKEGSDTLVVYSFAYYSDNFYHDFSQIRAYVQSPAGICQESDTSILNTSPYFNN